jgi:hypothetical protein
MQKHKFTRRNTLVRSYGKGTNIWVFLQTVQHIQPIAPAMVQRLALRFNISTDTLTLLIRIAANGGALYAN